MKERKVSIVGQRDTVLVNKELIFHLKNHLAKDLVIKDHIPKKHGPEKRRKESKLKHDLLRKSSVLNAACMFHNKVSRSCHLKSLLLRLWNYFELFCNILS